MPFATVQRLIAGLLIALIIAQNPAAAQTTLSTPASADDRCQGDGCLSQQSVTEEQRNQSGRQQLPIPRSDGSSLTPSLVVQSGQVPYNSQTTTPLPQVAPTPEPQVSSEFQDFVGNALGRKLDIYAYKLFERVPTTFAPIDRVPVTMDYVIGPGDELLVRAWGQIDLDAKLVVDRAGDVYLPKVGNVSVAGLPYAQLQEHLKTAVGRVFRNFELSVNLGQLRSIQVFVVGQARRPGTYTVSSLSSLVNTVFSSGGPSISGSMRHIQLKRNNAVITELDLYDLLLKGDKSKDVRLLPGDVIYIPPVGPQVAVAGSVNVPSIYELRDRTKLGEALEMAGGLATTADGQKAVVERIENRSTRKIEEFPLNEQGFAREVRDGDLVRIFSISPKFGNAIILRGNVSEPGRYPWHEGMKVSDLIPNREFLLTRRYWQRQNAISTAVTLSGRNQTGRDLIGRSQTGRDLTGRDLTGRDLTGRDLTGRDLTKLDQYGANQPAGGTGTDVTRSERTMGAEETAPARTDVQNDVRRSDADINWDYALVQRINPVDLSTSLIPFNLQKAIVEKSEKDNVVLMPSDIVTIFSQKDMMVASERQSKFVRLEGEFRTPGVYRVEQGEDLRHLVERAGGLTPEAYLFGTLFTRESARLEQQASLDAMVDQLDMEVEHQSTAVANRAEAQQLEALQAKRESQRALVDKFRAIKATGRIVLEMTPTMKDASAFPTIALEDSDRLYVPRRPSTVAVVGSVYNQNSFLYRRGTRTQDYLKLAGSGTRDADLKHLFVVRANGSVVSDKTYGSKWLGGSLESLNMLPGDTVVIPSKLDRGTFMRGLKDWTQIISQMALGAASINVLK